MTNALDVKTERERICKLIREQSKPIYSSDIVYKMGLGADMLAISIYMLDKIEKGEL